MDTQEKLQTGFRYQLGNTGHRILKQTIAVKFVDLWRAGKVADKT